jgi:hypothetical protein
MNQSSEVLMSLPKTRLTLIGNELIKKSPKGDVVSRHTLDTIKDVQTIKKNDPICAAIIGISGLLAIITKFFIPSILWSWIAFIFFSVLSLFGLLAMQKYQIKIIFNDSEIAFDILDQPDEGVGFASSLKNMLVQSLVQDQG